MVAIRRGGEREGMMGADTPLYVQIGHTVKGVSHRCVCVCVSDAVKYERVHLFACLSH